MMGVLLFVFAAFLLAKPLARWLADRTSSAGEITHLPSKTEVLSPAEQKSQMLQDQVNSKIHWDAAEEEVYDWLNSKHNIRGEQAEAMIATARHMRVRAIRERALYGLICGGIGIVATGTPLLMELAAGAVFIFRSLALLFAFGFFLIWFGKNLIRFLSGQTNSTIDP